MARQLTDEQMVSLLVRYGGRVRAFLATLLPLSQDIDEVVQNACLVAWRKLDSFQYEGSEPNDEFLRWMCKIARLEAMNYRRKQNNREQLLDDALLDRIAIIQANYADYLAQQHAALERCLARLLPRDRDLVRRRYAEGASVESVAGSLGRSESAIYKALTRVRKLLLTCVQNSLRREVNA